MIQKVDNKQGFDNLTILLLLSFVASTLGVMRVIVSEELTNLFLIWNLFLCWVPYLISIYIYRYTSNREKYNWLFLIPLGAIWLLFFPNAPYIITDYIHFSYYDFLVPTETTYGMKLIANNDLSIWFDFMLFSLFIITGFLISLYSIYLIHKVLKSIFNNRVSWIFIILIYMLTGFGIYLGRFLRFNSWDIFTDPLSLFARILDTINSNSLIFSVMFGSFLLLIYFAFYKSQLQKNYK